jgi:ABC-2 type transport system permease protein
MKRVKELWAYREMIVSLVRKDLRGRYKGSVLGFMWTFINPLLQLVVYTIVFSTILQNEIKNFYLFLFVALVPWIFFSSALTTGATCIIGSKDMVNKIYFPREVLPISYVTSSFVNMLFSFAVIFFIIILSGTGINFKAILYLPIIMTVEYLLALGITMLTSALTVYFRDLEHILGIVTMAWMYLTPIMYSVNIVPARLLPIFYLNPMTPIIIAFRQILYYREMPDMGTMLHAFLLGILFLIIGWFSFSKLQRKFAEEL